MQYPRSFLAKFLLAYDLDHARGTLSVKTTAAARRSNKKDSVPSATPRVLDEAVFTVLLNGRHPLQELGDFQKARDVIWVEAPLLVQCVTRHYVPPVARMEALKISSLAHEVTSNICRDSSIVVEGKPVLNFDDTLEEELCVNCLIA